MKKYLQDMQRYLLTATSYMIPFVVAGGVIYSFSIMINGSSEFVNGTWLWRMNMIGQGGLSLYVPVLGGFIAYSIADKPGLAPGFIGAWLAKEIGAGFIGGIVAGYVAGYTVSKLRQWIHVPEEYRTLKTIFVYPIIGTVFTGMVVMFVIGEPIALLMNWMTETLNQMSGIAKAPLGLILGGMVGFDMGGPINKVAFTFAQSQIDTLPYLMGGVGCAASIPPIGVGLATILFKKKFSPIERDSGKAAILMGCMGITEGAIPFATNDVRMIPVYVIGSATGCAWAFFMGAISHVPWGGLIALPLVEGRIKYVAAILIGSMVVALITGLIKKDYAPKKKKVEVFDLDSIELDFEEI